MVKLHEAGPEQTTIAYATGDSGVVVLRYQHSATHRILKMLEEGQVGGKNISAAVRSKLENMVANLRHDPRWRAMPLNVASCMSRSHRRGGH